MEGTLAELRADEAKCVERFRQRAAELKAAHPDWGQQTCFGKAIESLPKTSEKYLYIRNRLQMAGIAALPLR
jgi:hypothetical protein